MSKQFDNQKKTESELLAKVYADLYNFDRSIIGRLFWFVEKLYFWVRLTPRTRSSYRLLIDQSKMYSFQNNIDFNQYTSSKNSRIRFLWLCVKYFVKHPYSSVRLISRYRIAKLFKMLINSSDESSGEWFLQRFPDDGSVEAPEIFSVSDVDVNSHEIIFPAYDRPEVSIIVPVYNQYKTTLSCLMSIVKNTQDIKYEVIVADDKSSDITSTISNRIKNIRVVRAEKNQGFLGNCNNAVKFAAGTYVVLLNNDTNVQSGWLRSLIDVIQKDPIVGMVGPKLLFEDGVLQEAGGIVWSDATGWNFGRGQDPNGPEFNYTREVDYISGACLLLQKSLWERVNGFDERFRPAYYEDTDLAFQIRSLGLKVVYQPKSVVVHFEGVSNGTDLGSGIKKYQLKNREVFYQKWESVLKKNHYDNGRDVFKARERNKGKTILIIDHYVPFYDKDAGSKSTFLYVKSMLQLGYRIKFLGANFFPHQPYTDVLQSLGVEVIYGERYARNWSSWLESNIKDIDVIYLHRPHITEDFIDVIRKLKDIPKLVYFGHDLHYLRLLREFELTGDESSSKASKDWRKREVCIFNKVDLILYPSSVEVGVVKSISSRYNVEQLPLYPLEFTTKNYNHSSRRDLLFVGGFGHPPNVDGMLWFLDDIFPNILQNNPAIVLHIVGSNVPELVSSRKNTNVVVHGFLSDSDLEQLYSEVRLCIVPLRFGAGIKGKVLEAIQYNIPIVTTSIGAEGLPRAEDVMVIEDEPNSFARAVLSLYEEEKNAQIYCDAHHDYIERYFSQKKVDAVIKQYF